MSEYKPFAGTAVGRGSQGVLKWGTLGSLLIRTWGGGIQPWRGAPNKTRMRQTQNWPKVHYCPDLPEQWAAASGSLLWVPRGPPGFMSVKWPFHWLQDRAVALQPSPIKSRWCRPTVILWSVSQPCKPLLVHGGPCCVLLWRKTFSSFLLGASVQSKN